jgi:hypothetical protein
MERDEPPRTKAFLNQPAADPESQELAPGNDTLLGFGQLANPAGGLIGRVQILKFAIHFVSNLMGWGARVARRTQRFRYGPRRGPLWGCVARQ